MPSRLYTAWPRSDPGEMGRRPMGMQVCGLTTIVYRSLTLVFLVLFPFTFFFPPPLFLFLSSFSMYLGVFSVFSTPSSVYTPRHHATRPSAFHAHLRYGSDCHQQRTCVDPGGYRGSATRTQRRGIITQSWLYVVPNEFCCKTYTALAASVAGSVANLHAKEHKLTVATNSPPHES